MDNPGIDPGLGIHFFPVPGQRPFYSLGFKDSATSAGAFKYQFQMSASIWKQTDDLNGLLDYKFQILKMRNFGEIKK